MRVPYLCTSSGDLFKNILAAEDEVLKCQWQYENDASETNYIALYNAKNHLVELHLQEEIYWRQKSRITWLREGDNNTRFFHAVVEHNRKRNTIKEITDDNGNTFSAPGDIQQLALSFYHHLFSTENCTVSEELLAYILSQMKITFCY